MKQLKVGSIQLVGCMTKVLALEGCVAVGQIGWWYSVIGSIGGRMKDFILMDEVCPYVPHLDGLHRSSGFRVIVDVAACLMVDTH